jgi:poly [ADP-ribose] polymerase 2/3/4
VQLIVLPNNHLHLYYKKSKVGEDPKAEERVEDFESRVDDAVGEFVRLFEELTGNEFEPWEREKKIEKKPFKFYPLDIVSTTLDYFNLYQIEVLVNYR